MLDDELEASQLNAIDDISNEFEDPLVNFDVSFAANLAQATRCCLLGTKARGKVRAVEVARVKVKVLP